MACEIINIDLKTNKALKALSDYCGTNRSQLYSYLTTVIKDVNADGKLEFTDEFISKGWKSKKALDIVESDATEVKDAIISFFYSKWPNAEDSYREARGFNKITQFGYQSIAAREEAKRDTANFMTLVMKQLQEKGEKETIKDFITKRITRIRKAEGTEQKDIDAEVKDAIKDDYNYYRKIYCAERAIVQMKIELADRLSRITGVDAKTIRKNLTDNNAVYINNLLEGHEEQVDVQLKNLIAAVKELITTDIYLTTGEQRPEGVKDGNPKKEMIDEIFWDSRLAPIRYEGKITEDDSQSENAQDENSENDEDSDPDNETKDAEYNTYIRVLNDKMGTYTTYMAHIDTPIRVLLGSLKKANPTTADIHVFALDTDNHLGIPDLMDANVCATVLYHMGRFNNPEDMLESIKEIAERIPGFGAFKQLHDILTGNVNLQYAFFSTFSKVAIGKLEVGVEHGQPYARITNNLNRQSTIKYRLLNSVKGSALSFVETQANDKAVALEVDIADYNKTTDRNGKYLRRICSDLADAFKSFYPDIDELTIRNYVLLNENKDGVVDEKVNLYNLHGILESTIKGAKQTLENYRAKQSKISLIKHNNYVAKTGRDNGDNAVTATPSELEALYAEGYISMKSEEAATQLAIELRDYTLITSPLNSRNVNGNQSSDIINSSMITNMKSILESELNNFTEVVDENGVRRRVWDENSPIMKLANHRFQQSSDSAPINNQYEFSNMLVEHWENGKRVNYGIFRFDKKQNKYVPTSYGTSMLQMNLFNGASNLDDGSNILYKQMSRGDYIGTAWRMFFNPSTALGGVEQSAEYFMRIPSDAPKTFSITAPRYGATGLLTIGNRDEIDSDITNFINKISANELTNIDKEAVVASGNPIYVGKHTGGLNLSSFISHINAIDGRTTNIKIPLNRQDKFNEDRNRRVRMAFRYAPNKEASTTDNVYVMEGIYFDGVLHEATFVGFAKDEKREIDGSIWADIRRSLWTQRTRLIGTEGAVSWKVKQDHELIRQLVNVFKQEITDMAKAANLMFERTGDDEHGYIVGVAKERKVNGKTVITEVPEPVLKKSDILTDNTNHNGLHPIYHFSDPDEDGHGKIYDIVDGKPKATGKVFTSDRFILFDYFAKSDDKAIRNFGQEIIDKAFALFEGNTDNTDYLLRFDKDGNVIFSDAQKQAIEEGITQFVLAYIDHTSKRLESVENFIDLNEETVDETSDYASEVINRTTKIADFILNTHLTYIGFNDLFEGDTKFYKNSQTFLKRAKEAQGSGVPYGTNDLTREFQPAHTRIPSILNNTTFAHKINGKIKPYNIDMYATFSGITVYNTIKTDTLMLDSIKAHLTNKDKMGAHVLTDEQAERLLYGPEGRKGKGGYQNTTVNDAQSYITFDEWVRRITARGQLAKYKPLIDRILDEDTPLSVDDIQEFVQVQKNFYYDQYYNPKTKVISPRQIKNAEFVLVPRFIRGTQLEKVEQLMRKLGVDQLNTVETSKAGHSERFTLWDNNGQISQDIIDDIDGKNVKPKSEIMQRGREAREYYNYNYLYTQQETPQHMDAANKAGIQVMKKIVDNIDENSPIKLQNAKRDFFNLYAEKIRRSFEDLMKRFNVTLDEHGNIDVKNGQIQGIDYHVFYDALKDELTRLGLDSNMVDYCTLPENAISPTGTIMPNYMSLVAAKFENIVQSLFNNSITRQTLPGFHAAQVTGIGFQKLGEKVKKDTTSNPLQYHPKAYAYKSNPSYRISERDYNKLPDERKKNYVEDGVMDYIEIMLPASAFGIDRNAPRYAGLSREAQDELILKDLRDAKLDEIIGYRIPTEGKQSIAKMKVVAFTDDAQGSTIIVPDAWVAQTGADFDIDSIYGIQYNVRYDETGKPIKLIYNTTPELYEEYVKSYMSETQKEQLKNVQGFDFNHWAVDHNLLSREEWVDENSNEIARHNRTKAIENKMLDLMKDMLTDAASFEENLSRSNFDDTTKALNKGNESNKIASKQRQARSPYNFLDQADYQEDAMSGAKLKAFSVVRDTFCSICNTLKPTLENDAEIRVFYPSTYSHEELEKRFNKYDEDGNVVQRNVIPSTGGFTVIHRTFGWTNDNKNVDGKILTSYSSQTTAHILDAMKTGNVPNVNDLTFQVYKTIVDIGSNFDTAVSFIMQPGIRRIVNAYNESNSIYSPERGKNYILKAVRSICDDLNIEYDYKDKVENLVNKINNIYNSTAAKLFGVSRFNFSVNDSDNAAIALNADIQYQRLSEEGIFSEETSNDERPDGISHTTAQLLYDLQTILQYNKIDNLANNIREAARVCNPDKFGAKQSIFATREVFNSMVDSIIDNSYKEDGKTKTNFRLQVDGQHLLSAIYPRIERYEKGDDVLDAIISDPNFVEDSKYKPLAAFLKYATATSVKINKTLFVTQSDEFRELIFGKETGLASKLTNGVHMSEKTARAAQNYIINYIVMQSEFLQAPLYYNMGKGGKRGFEYIGKGPSEYNEEEATRVFGYWYPASTTIQKTVINTPAYYEGQVEPDENTVFVFGSNTEGRHGAGAAKVAKDKFGAIYGVSEGLRGNSYALPTKNLQVKENNSKRSLYKSKIIENIKRMYDVARENPTKQFKVYHIPLGSEGLAGYTGEEMLEMFKEAGDIPANVLFHKEWVDSGKLGQDIRIEKEFTVENIADPTQTEVEEFCSMTPAQKVTWIQRRYSNPGVFRYVTAQLFNERGFKGNRAGIQSLHFKEEAADIETVRTEFYQAFTSKDPFMAAAAADVIKYAFFVEGYTMRMGHVSKMIKNDALLSGGRIYGTNIVNNTNDKIAMIDSVMSEKVNARSVNVIENFIRSHADTVGINTYNVSRTKDAFELRRRNDIIYLNGEDKTDRELAERYGITYEDKRGVPQPNSYVKLRFGKDTILYRITRDKTGSKIKYFLIPLNRLEPNENAVFSANANNNQFPSPEYYEKLIDNYKTKLNKLSYEDSSFRADVFKEANDEMETVKAQYEQKAVATNKKFESRPVADLNINNKYNDVKNEINDWLNDFSGPIKFVWYSPFSKYIKQFGKDGAVTQEFIMPDGSRQVLRITKVNLTNVLGSGRNFITRYAGNNPNEDDYEEDSELYGELIDIVKRVASYNTSNYIDRYFGDIYAIDIPDIDMSQYDSNNSPIEENDEDNPPVNYSTLLDYASNATTAMYRRAISKDDPDARGITRTWNQQEIGSKKETISKHIDDVIIPQAKYIEKLVNEVERKLKYHIADPETGNYLAVNDPKCIALVKKNPKLRQEYLRTLLEPQAIVDEFGLILDLDIEHEDPAMQQYLNKIKSAVEKMQNNPMVADAYEKFAKEYYDKLTDNPLVKQGLLSVLDGFYKTNRFNATFNDIQETSNPIVQIAMKNLQSDIRAKQFQASRQVEKFYDHLDNLEKEAKAAGMTINYNNIIDEYGRFIKAHTDKFIQDRDALQKANKDAAALADKIAEEKGFNSKEHVEAKIKALEAKLAYDEWKAKYLEQEVIDKYYNEKNELLHIALYGYDTPELKAKLIFETFGAATNELDIQYIKELNNGDYKNILALYNIIKDAYDNRRGYKHWDADVLQDMFDRVLNEDHSYREDIARYENLRSKRANLRRQYLTDVENPELDKQIEELDLAIQELRGRNSDLNNYVQITRTIENNYWKYEASYSFEEVLAENLRIIEAYEYGEKPYELYKNNPDYIKAKAWINRNASFEPDELVREELNAAYETLNSPERSEKVWHIKRNKDYFNAEGVFDPRLVPDDQLEKLKEDQARQYGVPFVGDDSQNDRRLISNGPESDAVYTEAFYNGITGGVKSATGRNGVDEYTWNEAVREINKVLEKYYDVNTKRVRLDHIPNNDEGLNDLRTLKKYYEVLDEIKGAKKSNKSVATKQFIENNVDEESYNKEQYDLDVVYARALPGGEFRNTMLDVIMVADAYTDAIGPNKFLYGTIKPKAEKTQFIDEEKTNALRTIKKYTERKVRKEWLEANVAARKSMTSEQYREWVNKNCIYNPYSRAYEPIQIWWRTEINKGQGTYFPKYEQTNKIPRDGYFTHKEAVKFWERGGEAVYDLSGNDVFENIPEDEFTIEKIEKTYIDSYNAVNKNWNPDGGHSENYKIGSNPEYDRPITANKFELEAKAYMQKTLLALANTQDAKRYLERGWLPARHKGKPNTARGWVQEIGKTFGFANEPIPNKDWYEDVDYYKDTPTLMPMLEKVKSKGSKEVPKRPKREKDDTDTSYTEKIKKWEDDKAQIEKENLHVHKENLDNDWKNVIADFITQAAVYNAVQDNKYELFYAKQLLKTHGAYITAYNNRGQMRFKKDMRGSTIDDAEYLRREDKLLQEQFDNQIRRVVYNQFKAPNNPKLLKWMSVLQSLTSAQYMMLNVKGGIANVTLGETQIISEAFANEFFGGKHWGNSKLFYNGGIFDYILHSRDDKASTLQGAIIKFFDVIDYDEHTGVSRLTKDAYEVLRRVRDLAYTPQTAGEHGMQNSAMFAMMMSHRLVENPKAEELGQPKYKFQNFQEYILDTHMESLKAYLDDKQRQKFEEYVDKVSSDTNAFKRYAWYQEDLASVWAKENLDRNQQKEWIKQRDQLVETRKKEFNNDEVHPTILSQLELGSNGKLAFKKDSMLAEIDKEKPDGSPSDALQLLANFKGRVIAVNKYIHGVYDKSGRAQIEKTFIGSLLMQYHKHLPLGLMKRYRMQGMWHEERGAVTKGMYRSLYDYLSLHFKQHKDALGLNDDEVNALEGLQGIVKNIVDFAVNFRLTYRMLPDYDRANFRRMRGDLCGVLAALFLTIAIKAGMDDDDEDGLLYNLALYEADRLATEAGQYIPFVAYTEAKKLWQSPVAAGSGITDLLSSTNLLLHMIFDGEDFDGEYHSGKFAGESKLKVYIERRIPMWRGIKSSFIDIVDNNHYYKIGENILNWVDVNEKAEWLKKHF